VERKNEFLIFGAKRPRPHHRGRTHNGKSAIRKTIRRGEQKGEASSKEGGANKAQKRRGEEIRA